MKHHYCKRFAFTLAEVLITLGIIGVVAALVLPGVIKGYQRKVMKTQFDRAVAVINQAVTRMQDDVGGDLWAEYNMNNGGQGVCTKNIREHFFSYLKGELEQRTTTKDVKPYYVSLKGSTTTMHYCPAGCCSNPVFNSFKSFDGIMYNTCSAGAGIDFVFDINGNDKGPNKWGIDLFDFDYTSANKLTNNYTDRGGCYAYYKNSTSSNVNDGISCTHAAMKDPKYFDKIDF